MIAKLYTIIVLCAVLTVPCGAKPTAAIDVDAAQALLVEARSKASTGQTAEAISLYDCAITLLPADPSVRKEFARLLARSGERAKAEELYKAAATLAPHDAELARERAVNLAAAGETASAALEYRRAFGLAPDDESAVRGYVQQIARLGAVPVALDYSSEQLAAHAQEVAPLLMLAELLRYEGKYGEALDRYWLAQHESPGNRVALRGAAEVWLALGYFERAEALFAQSDAKGEGDSARLPADRARVLLVSGRAEAARQLLAARPAEVEKSPHSLITLADVYHVLGQEAQERAVLERLQELYPDANLDALARLARVRFETGDKEAARTACERLLALDPKNSISEMGLSLLGLASLIPTAADARELIPARRAGLDRERGEAALFWNQPTDSLPYLQSALAVWPGSPRLRLALGQALLQMNNGEGAAAAFADLAVGVGQRPDALLGWARAEILRREPARALDIYAHLLRLDPNNYLGLRGRAEALLLVGDMKQAVVLLGNLARRAPTDSWVSERLRDTLSALGRTYRHSPEATSPQPTVEPLIAAGDTLRVRVAGHPEFNNVQRLEEDGLLRLPSFKEAVNASCLTERELSAEIARQSLGQLASAAVEVTIADYQPAPVIVSGAVQRPGRFYVHKPLSLRESLMLASDTSPDAGRSVYVLRGACSCSDSNTDPLANEVEIYERTAIQEERMAAVKPIRAGDVLFIPENDTAFITGAITTPGVMSVRERLTLLTAVNHLGGTLASARRDSVRLLRPLPDGSARQGFIISLDEIEQQRIGDIVLRPGDVVEIPAASGEGGGRSFAALLRRTALDAVPPLPQLDGKTVAVSARQGGSNDER